MVVQEYVVPFFLSHSILCLSLQLSIVSPSLCLPSSASASVGFLLLILPQNKTLLLKTSTMHRINLLCIHRFTCNYNHISVTISLLSHYKLNEARFHSILLYIHHAIRYYQRKSQISQTIKVSQDQNFSRYSSIQLENRNEIKCSNLLLTASVQYNGS